jgi:translocation protein SEC63
MAGSTVDIDEDNPIQPPLAFAPYFARDHSPRWHMFLTDNRGSKLVVPPSTFPVFDKPLLGADGKPSFAIQTFKLQFQAPPQVGQFPFLMHLICDSYIGTDTTQEILLTVEDAAKAEALAEEDDISEPDEGE